MTRKYVDNTPREADLQKNPKGRKYVKRELTPSTGRKLVSLSSAASIRLTEFKNIHGVSYSEAVLMLFEEVGKPADIILRSMETTVALVELYGGGDLAALNRYLNTIILRCIASGEKVDGALMEQRIKQALEQ